MLGSPYGHVFLGNLVRHNVTFGAGFRVGKSLYFDVAIVQAMSNENYRPFAALETRGEIDYRSTMLSLTGGFKF
jgi:hypothetical protein